MGASALLRPHVPLSLAPFGRISLAAVQRKSHHEISPSPKGKPFSGYNRKGKNPFFLPLFFCSNSLSPAFFLGFPSPALKLSRTDCSWNQHLIARRNNTLVRSGIAATSGSPDFSAHPFTESQFGSRIRGFCFYAVTAVAAILLFMAMVVAHPFVLLFDRYRRKAHHWIAKVWASVTVVPFYRVELEGLENLPPDDTPAVYVSNHQSFLDIYTLLTLGKTFKFISKRGVFLFPVIGWAMFLLGVIPLRRLDTRSQLDCLKRCIELVKKGASVYFFPEGTRSKDGKLCAFKKGAFSVAAKTEAPIVPITLLGTGSLMPPGMEGLLNSGYVKVVIHKPIQGTDADMLCDCSRNTIADTLLLHGYGVHQAE